MVSTGSSFDCSLLAKVKVGLYGYYVNVAGCGNLYIPFGVFSHIEQGKGYGCGS